MISEKSVRQSFPLFHCKNHAERLGVLTGDLPGQDACLPVESGYVEGNYVHLYCRAKNVINLLPKSEATAPRRFLSLTPGLMISVSLCSDDREAPRFFIGVYAVMGIHHCQHIEMGAETAVAGGALKVCAAVTVKNLSVTSSTSNLPGLTVLMKLWGFCR